MRLPTLLVFVALALPALAQHAPPEPAVAGARVGEPTLGDLRELLAAARRADEMHDLAALHTLTRSTVEKSLAALAGRDDDEAALFLAELGTFAHGAGEPRAAERVRERVLEVRTRTLPPDHVDLAKARGNLALSLNARGDLAGARALQEQVLDVFTRTLPDEHPYLQKARGNLAVTLRDQGDFRAARVLDEQVLEVRARTLPEEDLDLQRARATLAISLQGLGDFSAARALQEKALETLARTRPADDSQLQDMRVDLAVTLKSQGDYAGARALEELVIAVRTRTLPREHPDLLAVRQNFAATLKDLGDLRGARAIEVELLEIRERTLPDDHPDLQAARGNLAVTIRDLGDLAGARALQEKVLEVRTRTLPPGHPELWRTQQNLAIVLLDLGDVVRARALEERALESCARTLPDDHPDLQATRTNLAITLKSQGDLAAARSLEEKVLEVYLRTRPEDHLDVQRARGNLAATLRQQGDVAGARALAEKVLAVRERTLPDDHPDLQAARLNLALLLDDQGDYRATRALEQKVVEVRERTLPPDHPDVQQARANLAVTLSATGDLAGARALEEKVLEVLARTLPDEHPELQRARKNLACAIAAGKRGEAERARFVQLAHEYVRGLQRSSAAILLDASSREAEERCANLQRDLGIALSFAAGFGAFPDDPGLEREVFLLSESTRAAAQVSARIARLARDDEAWGRLRGEMRAASEEIARLARGSATPDAFGAAVARRDGAERALVGRARALAGKETDLAGLDLDALRKSLATGAAVVAYRRYRHWEEQRDGAGIASPESLCAFVVRAESELARVELGPLAPIEEAVAAWRRLGAPPDRGRVVPSGAEDAERAAGERLRVLVFDPLQPALAGAGRLIVLLDDVLHAVPIDALPAPRDERATLLGDRFAIEQRLTLHELLRPARTPGAGASLVALGGAAFNSQPVAASHAELAALETREAPAPAIAALLRGGKWERGFEPLTYTGLEARGIAALFEEVGGADAHAVVLEKRTASRASIEELAPHARWLHLATHGWFAPESVRSWSDAEVAGTRPAAALRMSSDERVRGTSPMVVCGLALAGANLPPDALGSYPGLVTAEEISGWDLSGCELAVLSACDTNVGERRGGQGVASLQRALHMAGARSVITSLWKVPDEATHELMLDFYRRLWVEKRPKGRALWEAKRKLRETRDDSGRPKYTTRDWAAWALTGEPD